ncbi:YkgJ family cysteine cluster protein [Caldivirga sp.]|jgi:Fe-S-cluster containining protein|uniref:YkgJ family cysteine cluster protein n=1 Tax=Caldivirga sp. TaxID=2080243 RepID=UPI0025C1B7F5|nr:YkgJ family cysteine cluster protein [Caldivirga sp.]
MSNVFNDLKYVEVAFKCTLCGLCCINTRMELLPEDIERIEQLGYRLEDFAEFDGEYGVWRLRNVNNHCVFFDEESKKCRIYENRPVGCRLYPLNYDDEYGVVVDKYCPQWSTVPVSEVRRLRPVVELFVRRITETNEYVRVKRAGIRIHLRIR